MFLLCYVSTPPSNSRGVKIALLSTHRVSEAEGGQIARGEHATGGERRQRSDVVHRLLHARRHRRRRGVLPAAEEGLQLQLRWALLHPSLGRQRRTPLSLSALLLSWLLLRPRRRPQSTRLLETGDAAKQSTEGGKKGLFGDRKRKETRRGKEGGKVAGCNGVRRGKQIAVSSGTAFARYLRVCHSAAPSAVMSPYGGSAVRRSVLPCWLRIGEKKKGASRCRRRVPVCPCYGLGVQSEREIDRCLDKKEQLGSALSSILFVPKPLERMCMY